MGGASGNGGGGGGDGGGGSRGGGGGGAIGGSASADATADTIAPGTLLWMVLVIPAGLGTNELGAAPAAGVTTVATTLIDGGKLTKSLGDRPEADAAALRNVFGSMDVLLAGTPPDTEAKDIWIAWFEVRLRASPLLLCNARRAPTTLTLQAA